MEPMNIARIRRVDGVIENIEVATQEWIDEQEGDLWYMFVPFPDATGNIAIIGEKYDMENGRFTTRPNLTPEDAIQEAERIILEVRRDRGLL